MRTLLDRRSALAFATTIALLGIARFASANSGTQLPFAQYQAGTEQTSSALVTNGNFEQPGAPNPNNNPTGWTLVNQFQVGTPINPTSPPSTVGNFAAQSGGQPDPNNPNKFTQNIALAANIDYVLSAYLWNFGRDFDLAIAELVDPNNGLNTVTLALSRTASDFGDGAGGYFVHSSFNSNQFPGGLATLEVEFDYDADFTDPRPAIVAQIDNVSITPAAQFQPPVIPEPSSLALVGAGLLAIARRRRSC